MDRTLLGITTTFAAALLLVGLTFSRSVDLPADLRFVNGVEPKSLDPQLMTGNSEGRIADAVFEGLTRRNVKTLEPAPGVAESWDISPDGKTYVFHLRQGARWTDGRPVTAHDFVYAWTRLLEPKTGAEYAYIIFPVRYAEAFSTFDGHAESLAKKIGPALAALRRGAPTGIDGATWQKALVKHHVHDAFRNESDPRLVDLLSRRSGRVDPHEMAWLEGTGARLAGRLRHEAGEARAHFGVDAGAFARDDRTLVVELRAPTPYFLRITAFYPTYPAPRWLTENPARRDDWFLPEHIVSNGPFRLVRWTVNDRIRLERSESYWGRGEVRARAVDVLSTENTTTAMNQYLTGEAHWLPDWYPKDLADQLKKRSDFYSHQGLSVYYYRLNTTRPPFDDRRVRKAVNLAVDRNLVVDVLGLGQIPATTFVPPGIAAYVPPRSDLRLDVARARALLAEAGYPEGRGLPEIGILYNTNDTHKRIAEMVADQLRRNLGIRANAYNQEWQSFLETSRNLDYGMARAGWTGDYLDPNTFLDMWVTNGGNNQTGFSSPVYDRLVRAAGDVGAFAADPEALLAQAKEPAALRAALDEIRTEDLALRLRAHGKLRMLLFREAEALLIQDELPILPVYFYVDSGLVHPKVRGFYSRLEFPDGSKPPNLQDLHPLRDLWVEPGGAP